MKNILRIFLFISLFYTYSLADNNTSIQKNIEKPIKKSSLANIISKPINIESIPEIKITIEQPINWYMVLLPITTIVIVIIGFLMTRKQLEEKTKESINSFDKTIEKQTELAKNEIKLEVLSKNRQNWINSLRDELSRFMGTIKTIDNKHRMMSGRADANEINSFKDEINNLGALKYKIYLLLNPEEDDNKILLKKIEEIILMAYKKEQPDKKLDEIIKISQKVLKEEWKRVKKLK